jgi:hypothetical protein
MARIMAMWVQDAMVLAASWPGCPDLLGHFLEQPVRPETDGGRMPSDGPPARPTDLKVSTAAKYSNDRTVKHVRLHPDASGQREKNPQRLLRGVRDEAVMSMD